MIVLILNDAGGDSKVLPFKENENAHCDRLFVTSRALAGGH
jgi:hypothetical protein